jgi:hypothetical protein
VWAAVWRDGRSELIVIERDPNAPWQGYSAQSYQAALEEGLLPIYNNTRRFQQDNTRIHNFGGTPKWLQEHGIEYIDWPPHSPDLNPIEYIWKALKQKVLSLFPHLRYLRDNLVDREELKRCLMIAWAAIPQELIQKLINSLKQRLHTVIQAQGYYTEY